MAIQKQWQRNQSHTSGTCAAFVLIIIYSKNEGKVMAYTSSTFSFFVHQVPSCISSQSPRLHASNPNLSTTESNTQEVCPESPDSPTDASRLQEDFCVLANNSESLLEVSASLLSRCKNFRWRKLLFYKCMHLYGKIVSMTTLSLFFCLNLLLSSPHHTEIRL